MRSPNVDFEPFLCQMEKFQLAIELSSDALGSIDTVVVILSDYSDTGVR